MAQDDNQNRNQDQREGYQDTNSDQTTRQGRDDRSDGSQQQNQGGSSERRDQGSDVEEMDETDEDRDDDSRIGAGPNRRNSIS